MRILITGKHSFIGKSIKYYLKDNNSFTLNEVSVRDDNWKNLSFKNYDVIIHLAALVHKNGRNYSLKDYEKVNVELTLDIAKKAIEEGVGKFIFFSSMAVFGKVKVIKRDTQLNPISNYGISKLKAENSLKDLVKNTNMSLTIIRPPMVYGAGASGNAFLIEKISKLLCFFPETFNRKSFLSVENLIKRLIEEFKNKKNQIIHPHDPKYFSTYQLFSYYRFLSHKKAYPMKIFGFILSKFIFINFINKIFGDLYYDFYD